MPKQKLNQRDKRFLEEYLVDLNGAQAMLRAGFKGKNPGQAAHKILTMPAAQAMLEELMRKRSERTEITQDYVLTAIRETVERCRQAEPVRDRAGKIVEGEWQFDSRGVLKGAELLGSHLGMWKQKHEHTGKDGAPLQPPVINLGFGNGGPGDAAPST